MPAHNTSVTTKHPALDALEEICDLLYAVGSERLTQPLRNLRLSLHRALAFSDSISESSLCRLIADQVADIASEARRQDSAALFSHEGVSLTSTQEQQLDHGADRPSSPVSEQEQLVQSFREVIASIIDLLDVRMQFDAYFSVLTRAEAVSASFVMLYPNLSVHAFVGEMDTAAFLLRRRATEERER